LSKSKGKKKNGETVSDAKPSPVADVNQTPTVEKNFNDTVFTDMYKDNDYCAEVANALPGANARAADIRQFPLQPAIMRGRRNGVAFKCSLARSFSIKKRDEPTRFLMENV
jgi:hypothetical protein